MVCIKLKLTFLFITRPELSIRCHAIRMGILWFSIPFSYSSLQKYDPLPSYSQVRRKLGKKSTESVGRKIKSCKLTCYEYNELTVAFSSVTLNHHLKLVLFSRCQVFQQMVCKQKYLFFSKVLITLKWIFLRKNYEIIFDSFCLSSGPEYLRNYKNFACVPPGKWVFLTGPVNMSRALLRNLDFIHFSLVAKWNAPIIAIYGGAENKLANFWIAFAFILTQF